MTAVLVAGGGAKAPEDMGRRAKQPSTFQTRARKQNKNQGYLRGTSGTVRRLHHKQLVSSGNHAYRCHNTTIYYRNNSVKIVVRICIPILPTSHFVQLLCAPGTVLRITAVYLVQSNTKRVKYFINFLGRKHATTRRRAGGLRPKKPRECPYSGLGAPRGLP